MLKLKSLSVLIATTVVIIPTVFSRPASAQTNIYRVRNHRNHVVARKPYRNNVARVVKFPNGNIKLPNGNIVPAKKVVRLRNGYMRLPNGHIVHPNGEFFDAKDVIVLSNNRRRLPNGVTIIVND